VSGGYYTSHFYANGQHCDETGKGRATEVQFFCCGAETSSSSSSSSSSGGGGGAPHILDLAEPGGAGTCKYILRVCVPALCAEHPMARALSSVFRAQKAKAAGLGAPAQRMAAGVQAAGAADAAGAAAAAAPQQAGTGADAGAGAGGAEAVAIPHRELTPPSEAYDARALPDSFYAAALSALVGEEEVAGVAGRHWGGSGGPVQFR
jgi:hypothetical protein